MRSRKTDIMDRMLAFPSARALLSLVAVALASVVGLALASVVA